MADLPAWTKVVDACSIKTQQITRVVAHLQRHQSLQQIMQWQERQHTWRFERMPGALAKASNASTASMESKGSWTCVDQRASSLGDSCGSRAAAAAPSALMTAVRHSRAKCSVSSPVVSKSFSKPAYANSQVCRSLLRANLRFLKGWHKAQEVQNRTVR